MLISFHDLSVFSWKELYPKKMSYYTSELLYVLLGKTCTLNTGITLRKQRHGYKGGCPWRWWYSHQKNWYLNNSLRISTLFFLQTIIELFFFKRLINLQIYYYGQLSSLKSLLLGHEKFMQIHQTMVAFF